MAISETSTDAKAGSAEYNVTAYYVKKAAINSVCTEVEIQGLLRRLPQDAIDKELFEVARFTQFKQNGRASQFLDYFLSATGKPLGFELADLLREDQGVRERIAACISSTTATLPSSYIWDQYKKVGPVSKVIQSLIRMTGEAANQSVHLGIFEFPIRQQDFKIQDWCYALGSYTLFWEPIGASASGPRGPGPVCSSQLGPDWIDAGTLARQRTAKPGVVGMSNERIEYARLYGAKEYHWHEHVERADECLHQAGFRLNQSAAAKNFWMVGTPCYISISTARPTHCLPA